MIYCKTITSIKGGSSASPVQDRLAVTRGLIYQFELYFPPGSSGLLKVRLTDGSAPLYPSDLDEWFFGDNTLITFPDRYMVASPDWKLVVWHYNEDDTYDHIFQIRIGQVLAEEFIASFLPGIAMESLSGTLEKIVTQQQAATSERMAAVRGGAEYIIGPYPEEEIE